MQVSVFLDTFADLVTTGRTLADISPSIAERVQTGLAPERRARPWATPGDMAVALDRTTIQTPALQLIDQHLVDVAEGRTERLLLSMPPQEGKSERTSRRFPLWMLHRNPNQRVAIVSFGHDVARRWGRKIRDDLVKNPQLGLQLRQDSKRQDEFELVGYEGGVVCVGVEGGLTSRAVDLLIIDDPYKDAKQADSDAWQETVRDFWTEVALPRLGPGAPVVVIQTRWRKDDLAGWLQDEGDDWTVVNLAAQAIDTSKLPEADREHNQPDPLGRRPGEYLESARSRSTDDWEKKRREVGSRSWNALYQGRPSPLEGGILKRGWWKQYDQPLWLTRDDGSRYLTSYDELLLSWDLTFKDTQGTDFVVGQVWMRRGASVYLLDQVRARMDFPTTCSRFREVAARWPQATMKLVEDKANGPAVIAALQHTVFGIIPEEPHGSKTARAAAVSVLVEAGNVWLPSPELAPWVGDLIEEAAAFPNGSHDDQVDAMSQALNRLVLQPLLAGETFDEVDMDEDLADFGISLY